MSWSCDATRDLLRQQQNLPSEAAEHIAGCSLCQDMVAMAPLGEPQVVNDKHHMTLDLGAVYQQTQARIAAERGTMAWLRSLAHAQQLALGLALVAAPAAIVSVVAHRADLDAYPVWRLVLFIMALGTMTMLAVRVLLTPLHVPHSRVAEVTTGVLAFCLPIAISSAAPAHSVGLDAHSTSASVVISQVYPCLRMGVAVGLPALVLLLAMNRVERFRIHIAVLAAAAGGIAGNLALLLHCGNEERAHRLLGHAAVGVVLLLFCAVFALLTRARKRLRQSL